MMGFGRSFGPSIVRRVRIRRRLANDGKDGIEPLTSPSDEDVLTGRHGDFPVITVGENDMADVDEVEIEGEIVPSSRGPESYPYVRFVTDPVTGFKATPEDDTTNPEVASRMYGWGGYGIKPDPNPGATAVLRAFPTDGEVH